VQVNQLLSIKTGACPEDCGYCSQSVHNDTGVKPEPLMAVDEVVRTAKRAKANGVTRFCMGAAWRDVKDNAQFDRVLDMVRQVQRSGARGVRHARHAHPPTRPAASTKPASTPTTQPRHVTRVLLASVITTRTYQERLDTIDNLRTTKITVCCGGIIGMGESVADRIYLPAAVGHPPTPPGIGADQRVVACSGYSARRRGRREIHETVRMIAAARVLMPASVGAHRGRPAPDELLRSALVSSLGANSIFSSDRNMMLTATTPCARPRIDRTMLATMGLRPRVLEPSDR